MLGALGRHVRGPNMLRSHIARKAGYMDRPGEDTAAGSPDLPVSAIEMPDARVEEPGDVPRPMH